LSRDRPLFVTELSLVLGGAFWLDGAVPAKRAKKSALTERDLSRWKLIAEFQTRLAAAGGAAPEGTWADPRRELAQGDYLSLLLFGLFNPVVESMRGLCAASHLRRVQEEVCTHPVSLGSFSEAQAVVAPELLQQVFAELAAERREFQSDPRLARYGDQLVAIDGTLWAALPRMTWALWRWQHGPESALKAHVKFNLLQEKPVAVAITPAKRCERGSPTRQPLYSPPPPRRCSGSTGSPASFTSVIATTARTTGFSPSCRRPAAPLCCGCGRRRSSRNSKPLRSPQRIVPRASPSMAWCVWGAKNKEPPSAWCGCRPRRANFCW